MTTGGRPFIGPVAQTRLSARIGMERWSDHTTTGRLRSSLTQGFPGQVSCSGLLRSSLGSGKVGVDVYAFARHERPRAGLRHDPGFGTSFFRNRALNFFQLRQGSPVRHSLFRGSWTSGGIVCISSVLRIDVARAAGRFAVANASPGNVTAPCFLTSLLRLGREAGPDRLAGTVGARCPAMRHVCPRVTGRGSFTGLNAFFISCFSARPAAS